MFCITKIRHDPSAKARPIMLFEKVNEHARMTPMINGTSAVYTFDE
jgi:hypothetical protein